MKILVTGSNGTIGTKLCETLMDSGHEVTGVDYKENPWNERVDNITLPYNLLHEETFEKLPTDVDIVVHLAAHARVYELVKDPKRALENMTDLFYTLEWARKNNVKRFIFASSRECYGNITIDSYTEDTVRVENCESPYTASKLGGEAFVTSYDKCYDMGTVILRFSNVYGAYDNSDRAIPLFIRKARKNEDITIFGKNKKLDFTYIDDNVQGIILTIEKFDDVRGETFNIASGIGTELYKSAEMIIEHTGSSSKIVYGDPRVGEVTHYTANIDKAKRLLGYKPQYSFEEGMKKAVEWYLEHGY